MTKVSYYIDVVDFRFSLLALDKSILRPFPVINADVSLAVPICALFDVWKGGPWRDIVETRPLCTGVLGRHAHARRTVCFLTPLLQLFTDVAVDPRRAATPCAIAEIASSHFFPDHDADSIHAHHCHR